MREVAPDPVPASLTNDVHYLTSNERRLDLFADDVHGLGGAYVGVGTDQAYILGGWARPSVMVLVDFDQDVVDLHAIYGIFFVHARTPEQFARMWSEAGAGLAEAVITLYTPELTRRGRLVQLYQHARSEVHARLRVMQTKMDEAAQPWFLDDRDQYRHLATLFADGRVIALRGDFVADGVVRAVGGALDEAGVTARVVYLSNIEQYFMYDETYKANIRALPMDDRSVVLRTLPARPAGFEYIVQAGLDFQAWLAAPHVYSVYRLRARPKGKPLTASVRHVIDTPAPKRRQH